MKVVGFVGYPLSGKTTASQVAVEIGIPTVNMGDVVREEVAKRNLPLTDENLGNVASDLRKKFGMDIIARLCIPKIRKILDEKGVVVVDGIRGIDEVERFKKTFGDDFILIAIEAPLEIRFERAKRRMRSDDVLTIEELKKRDEREESFGLKKAMEVANFTVENSGDIEIFKEKIKELLKSVASGVEVIVETYVHPTEDEEKVKKAVRNLFPDSEIEIKEGKLIAKARDLRKFRELLRIQKILDTARSEITRGRIGSEVIIYLNKQAATVSKVNFTDEDAILSPLKVTFRLMNVPFSRFLDYIAPETRNGKIIKEIDKL
ncbi:MAG: AAA family ATPase [Archaeoglobaceae archaeon]|nr:AAA family ATPase [Archaeoglobaceae archaeon]MCX8151569.1 AAA family ATPase [Archaeoglobaceae archaeon]MDW8013153.1 AAA family ATPase [Archaeoglobaceae archaeon]